MNTDLNGALSISEHLRRLTFDGSASLFAGLIEYESYDLVGVAEEQGGAT